jgi:anti-sigma regulatory factor (Ser/Thr protein kinase)
MANMRFFVFPTVRAPSEARRGLDSLAGRIDPESLSDLKTVVSELVTISVAHGATEPIDVSLTLVDGEIEGVFFDNGPGTRAIVRAREQKDSSLVLRLVDSLVDDWGTNPGRTRTWFRMTVRPD